MESDLRQHQHPPMFQEEQQQINSGLTRYRSAPSSYFTNIIDKDFYEHIFNRPSSPETERVFSRFITSFAEESPPPPPPPSSSSSSLNNSSTLVSVKLEDEQPQQQQQQQQPVMASINNNESLLLQQQSTTMYQSSSARPPLPPMKTGFGNTNTTTSNLIRHSSSPAGLFANINIDTIAGYAAAMGGGGGGGGFGDSRGMMMSSIAEIEGGESKNNNMNMRENINSNTQTNEAFGETQSSNDFMASFGVDPWDDSPIMPDNNNITGLKRYREDDVKPFSAETKSERGSLQGGGGSPLTHHLSLPKTATEMAAIEKLLQYSDSVPCKIRAKRGCATHPRSIAERVRRTKISERMRKLQDLVPNMDKQTNTADMLDLAVDYIKDLQNQVQTLTDNQARCTCSQRQHQ